MHEKTGAPPAVAFTSVVKTFGDVRAVDGVDLRIEQGGTVALLGRNGAGKSTAISLLLGLNEPDEGEVELLGTSPARATRRGLTGAMLQEARAVPRVTVRELVTFVAGRYPAPLPVAETLELAEITELSDSRVDRLSGGQTQRVRFAMALAGNPSLLVLDEPTAAMDVEARHVFWESMRAYAERGHTVLFSTHYLQEADDNAQRIIVLDHGRIIADGTGEHLRRSVGGSLVTLDPGALDTATLKGLPGVQSVHLADGRAHLRTQDSDATVVALAHLGAIRDLAVSPASLDDAFLALTAPEQAVA
ncbi:ABC transporter ATP-binding protein [Streptomyces sp. NPDC050560]|uniref:ABC transporter ATP-binding protein n=1 Tax=Streptomyces sp. NPDC050560 TaxID=3365630 RepID=UPI0037922AD2